MRSGGRRERGLALVASAVWLIAIFTMAAIAIEVARLTDAATEVQVAADAAAFAANVALGNTQTTSLAQAAGKSAAARNFVDGHAVDPDGVQIDIGHYDQDPTVNPHFSPACTQAWYPAPTYSGASSPRSAVARSGSSCSHSKQSRSRTASTPRCGRPSSAAWRVRTSTTSRFRWSTAQPWGAATPVRRS